MSANGYCGADIINARECQASDEKQPVVIDQAKLEISSKERSEYNIIPMLIISAFHKDHIKQLPI